MEAWECLGRCCQGSPATLELDDTGICVTHSLLGAPLAGARPTGEGHKEQAGAGGSLPQSLGMSGPAESPLEAGERPTYRDRWGPRQATPIRQDGVPGQCYKYLG